MAFAVFRFEEGGIHCALRDDLARKYVTRLYWRIAAGIAAGLACWGAQRIAICPDEFARRHRAGWDAAARISGWLLLGDFR